MCVPTAFGVDRGAMIEGVVDDSPTAFSVSGWAIDRDGHYPLTIEARQNGKIIAKAETSLGRPDLGGAFGYSLAFETPVDSLLADDGSFEIVAMAPEGNVQALGLNGAFLDTIDARRIGRWLAQTAIGSVSRILDMAATIEAPDPEAQEILTAIRGQLPIIVANPAVSTVLAEPLATITTATGVISFDGRAITGKDGHLFPNYGGRENAVPFPVIDPASVSAWLDQLADQAAELEHRGVGFVQAILPEKASLLPLCWPAAIDGPSPLLRHLEEQAANRALPYLNLLDGISDHPRRSDHFRQLGTQLTAIGAQSVFAILCRTLGFEPPFLPAEDRVTEIRASEFHENFPALPLLERVDFIDGADLRAAAAELTAMHTDERQLAWHNPTAPIDAHLLAFGDLGTGAGSDTLAWWFARAFRRFGLILQSKAELEVIAASSASHVIVVTSERELGHHR